MFPYMYFLCSMTLHIGSAFWIIPLGRYSHPQCLHTVFHLQDVNGWPLTAQQGTMQCQGCMSCCCPQHWAGPVPRGAFGCPLPPQETALSLGQELTFSGRSLGFHIQESICFSESSPMQEILVLKYLASGFFLSFSPFSFLFFFSPHFFFPLFSSIFPKKKARRCRGPADMPAAWLTAIALKVPQTCDISGTEPELPQQASPQHSAPDLLPTSPPVSS